MKTQILAPVLFSLLLMVGCSESTSETVDKKKIEQIESSTDSLKAGAKELEKKTEDLDKALEDL